jgi:hypothetical protein
MLAISVTGRSLRRGVELAQPPPEHGPDLPVVDAQLGQRVLERAHDELDLERGLGAKLQADAVRRPPAALRNGSV